VSGLDAVAAKIAAEVEAEESAPDKAEKPSKVVEAADASGDGQDVAAKPADTAKSKAEADARARGWKPKEEWDGDPDEWVSAKLFIKKGEEIEDRQKLKKSIKALEAQNKELGAIVRASLNAQTQEKAQALLNKRDNAIEMGDKAQVRQIETELGQIGQVPQPTPAEITDWVAKHSEWWGVDPMATQAAVAYYGNLEAKDRADMAGNLEKTEKWLKKRFPDLFAEDQAKAAEAAQAHVQQTRKLSSVSVPSSGGGKPAGKSWGDLPSDAKRVGEELVRKGVLKREEYVTSFFERQG
jgi:hypothetical protein